MANMESPLQEVFTNFQKMTVDDQDVNILLLGETGVGKSTFINAFANYLEYDKFHIAENNKVRCLIPAKFTITNNEYEEKIVQIGSDGNENDTIAESATLETRSYVFPIDKDGINRIRLIDTPGICDTRGINQDNENIENILSYISHLEYLHAICFLLKPNNSRLTVMFEYCIKQLLSRLEKNASRNIIFLFTNTRSSFYMPGDTTTALKRILGQIKTNPPFVDIMFGKDNVFCLDNEAFRYMVAIKSGIQLGNKESFSESWAHSVKECWRMINFITGKGNGSVKITPHKVKDTISVNEARKVVLQLSQPLADIADLINDNINVLERHNKSLQTDNMSIAELKKNLYIPVINLQCEELTQPTTVCVAQKCIEIYTVGQIKKYHYKQRCHDPCFLQNVPKEHIGSPELVNCWAMTNRKCKICSCDYSTHMHIYYISRTYEDKIDNEGVKVQIKDRETALNETKKMISKIESKKLAYENEKDTIIKTMAKFAHFLQRNAIAPYNDSYKGYIEYLIDREKSLGENCDFAVVKQYNDLLKRYDEEKNVLESALASNASQPINASSVFDTVESLYRLPHTGNTIKELYSRQSRNQAVEHGNTEIVLNTVNEQLKQNKQHEPKNRNRSTNKNNKGKGGISQNNQPHLKAKDKRPDNNKGRNKNYNSNQQNNPNPQRNNYPGRNPNIPPLLPPGYPIPPQHWQRGNQPNYSPNPYTGPPLYSGNHSGMQGPFPNSSGPQGHFPNSSGPQGHFPNGPGPQGYFPNGPGQQGYFPPNSRPQGNFQNYSGPPGGFPYQPGRPDFSNYQNQQKYGQNQFSEQNFNQNLNNTGNQVRDPQFEEWFRRNVTGNTNEKSEERNDTKFKKHYNDLSKKQESTDDDDEEEESDNSGSSNLTNEQSDDEDFKEFLRKNNLERLTKPSTKKPSVNDSTNKSNKNKKGNGKNDDSDEGKNNEKEKRKGLLNNIFNMF